jgi:streptogramin lyase
MKIRDRPIEAYPVTYQVGHLSIENGEVIKKLEELGKLKDCSVGVQVASDGRIWVCVNGLAFLRFKPSLGASEGDDG